jgi:hypothetical protein
MKVQRKPSNKLDAIETTTTNALIMWIVARGGETTWFHHCGTRWHAIIKLDGDTFGPIESGEIVVMEIVGRKRQLAHMSKEIFALLYDVIEADAG